MEVKPPIEEGRPAYVTLGWADRALIVLTVIGIAVFLWGIQELRLDRMEARQWNLFRFDERLDGIEQWRCSQFGKGCPS